MPNFSNPYDGQPKQPVPVRISAADYAYLKDLLPHSHGKFDSVLATLFHAYVTELRQLFPQPLAADRRAWHADHPTLAVAVAVLKSLSFNTHDALCAVAELQRQSVGRTPGDAPPSPVERRDSPAHKDDGDDENVSTDSERETSDRERAEDSEGQGRQCASGGVEVAGNEGLERLLRQINAI